MADINKLSYTNRDYLTIFNELKDIIPSVSKTWVSRDESDPGIVLLKLISMIGDTLSFNQDKMALEVYPNTVTQRKNAAQIYNLIGYKMHWYKSATCNATVTTSGSNSVLPVYCRFSTGNDDIVYTYVSEDENPISVSNVPTSVELVQGIPVTPTRISNDYGDTIFNQYSYNVNSSNVTENRIYFNDQNVDESHIRLYDDSGSEWTQVDNLDITISTGRYFEFKIDNNNMPYIELVSYWNNYNIGKFKLFYIISSGKDGEIAANTLSSVDISGDYYITNEDSTIGYDPETPDEARSESVKYVNTYDTLVTLDDFERATLRLRSVNNCIARDYTNDPDSSEKEEEGKGSDNKLKVTIYVDPKDINESASSIEAEIATDLRSKKMIPLDIVVKVGDVSSPNTSPIKYCNWTVKGNVYLTEPVTRDKASELITRVNTHLKSVFDTSNVEFNTEIRYIDVINAIMEVDKLIRYVDLDKTDYYGYIPGSNETYSYGISDLTGLYNSKFRYSTSIDQYDDDNTSLNLNDFDCYIDLHNSPILPGSFSIRINNNISLIKDDGYGNIICNDPILKSTGSIDYASGSVNFELVVDIENETDIYIEYKKNVISIARYNDLSSNDFVISADSIRG